MARSLNSASPRPPRGFTLVEILVVVAIIVILMAILIPVTMGVISKARNAAIAFDIRELKVALEKYKETHGDYPPSMDWDPTFGAATFNVQASKWSTTNPTDPSYRFRSTCEKHLLRCYPKMTPLEKEKFYTYIAPILEQDEALVFWLVMVADDPREPFKNFVLLSNNNFIFYANGNDTTRLNFNDFPGGYTRHVHFDFDPRRLADSDNDGIPGYVALYARDTTYMYFDSRTYGFPTVNDPPNGVYYAARGVAQPFSDAAEIAKGHSKFMNPNTFQIVCAGQDGDFGLVPRNSPFGWLGTKMFPTMINCNEEDSDNIADFTEGARLIDKRP